MRRILVAALLLGLFSTDCALLKNLSSAFKEPTLTFKSASLADASLGGATVNLVFSVENPNSIGISLADVTYAFSVEGKQVVAGQPPAGLQIPAGGSADLTFPASVKFSDLASVVETFLTKDSASYRAEGQVGFQTPVGVLHVPLFKEGEFEVPKVPKFEFGSPRIAELSLAGATLEFPVTVTNRSPFALAIQSFSGALQIAGANVGTLSSGDFGQLEAKGSRQLTLPVAIHFAQAGAVAAALREGRANVSLSGQVHSGGTAVPLSITQVISFLR